MTINFHIFVLICTILFYFILYFFKKSTSDDKKKSGSHLLYVLYVPFILYISNYLFSIEYIDSGDISSTVSNNKTEITELLTSPYPVSTSSS